jgi:hypothetical protein
MNAGKKKNNETFEWITEPYLYKLMCTTASSDEAISAT